MSRVGDGISPLTAFRPNAPNTVSWHAYTVGTKFLVASPDDLTAYGSEITVPALVKAAATLYGITPDMLGHNPDGSASTSILSTVKQAAMLAVHAPVALAYRIFS